MASKPEWRSLNFYMNDVHSHELFELANEFENFIRKEVGEIEFFFMGEVLHFKHPFAWNLLGQLQACFKAFQAGWFAGREVMVEDIGREGL